jgi:ferredoxin-NADP reductase
MAIFEPFPYYPATVTAVRDENSRTKTFTLDVAVPWKFRAGHHCVIRLTDENGYIAARDYSISSAPSSGKIEVTVLLAKGGEVSTRLHERMKIGDTLQISKPLGSDFTWEPAADDPLLLIAGGIGIAPLISMLREHRLQHSPAPVRVAYSVRTEEDISFSKDLVAQTEFEQIDIWTTRSDTRTARYHSGRINSKGLAPLLEPGQRIYICGPTPFVDAMEKLLHFELGVGAEQIFTERFG